MSDSHAAGTLLKGDHRLISIDDWHRFAAPKRDIHWKDGRSAKENARAWIEAAPDLQPDIARTLAACSGIGTLRQWHAEPEARVPIDGFRGEQPNIDLLLVAEDDRGPIVIAVEAKADEPFGDVLSDQYRKARDAHAANPRSKRVARIEALLARFDLDMKLRHVAQLRYQLLTATAAALAEAERRASERAIVIAHEFVTSLTVKERRERNAADLDRFLSAVFGRQVHLALGAVAGPIPLKGSPTVYVGKAQTVI